ncbi:hypothetical protein KUTeg_002688 [Tegillarca granosa]|uniref:Uncharacterized protein n=1 Tax=Tegillarca granosa TaxID=220873 RepID=A0ABQ9FYA8_TEGGR|nr:hypothetical protein KUTeg_002688 [Tegillarca granosa]
MFTINLVSLSFFYRKSFYNFSNDYQENVLFSFTFFRDVILSDDKNFYLLNIEGLFFFVRCIKRWYFQSIFCSFCEAEQQDGHISDIDMLKLQMRVKVFNDGCNQIRLKWHINPGIFVLIEFSF